MTSLNKKCFILRKIILPPPVGLIKSTTSSNDVSFNFLKIFISIVVITLTAIIISSCDQAEENSANGIPPSGDKLDLVGNTAKVTFTVDMSSQKILGFFKPEEGDKVALEYSVNDTLNKAATLKKYDTNIYEAVINFPIGTSNDSKPIEYRYKIITNRKAVLQNNGYENGLRLMNVNEKVMNLPTAYFNNIQKVIRFIINTEKWTEEGKFKPLKDNISIKLFLKDKSFTEPLTKLSKNIYEAAVELPPAVENVKWQVVKDKDKKLTNFTRSSVDSNGEIIRD